MDETSRRGWARLVGALAAVSGVSLAQFLPQLLWDNAVVRLNALWFYALVFGSGYAGGGAGHFMFLTLTKMPVKVRALYVGGSMGFAVALKLWIVTYLFPSMFVPFEYIDSKVREQVMGMLPRALIAGVLSGAFVAIAIALFFYKEPEAPLR